LNIISLFEYLTESHDKISNKKHYFENDEFFYIVNIEKTIIYVYIEKGIIGFKLMMLELEKRDLEMI